MTSPAEYALGLNETLSILSGDSGMLSHTTSASHRLFGEVNLMIGQASLALIVDEALIG